MANSSFTKGSIETPVPVNKGGTGATSESAARTALGLGSVATEDTVPVSKGGTGLTSVGTAGQALVTNTGATGLEWGEAGHTGTQTYIPNAAGYLTCGTAGSIANFQAVSDGGFKVTIDGTERAVGSLDFTSTPWNIAFTNDSVQSNSLATESPTNGPYGVRFSSDGTKFYVRSGESGNFKIFQYNMSTPWDITTSSYSGSSLDLSSQTTNATDFWINSTGQYLFVFGGTSGNDYCWRYNLGTAWSISSASYHSVSPQFTQSSNTGGGILSEDGLFLYNFDNSANAIDIYSLSSAWTITSPTYLTTTGTEGRFGAGSAQWSHDGRYFWYWIYGPTGYDNYYIYRWTLATPYDLRSVTKYTTRGTAISTSYNKFAFKPDGTKIYFCDNGSDRIRQWSSVADVNDAFDVALTTEDAIQALTSSTEKVDYVTNHYVITSATADADSEVSVMSAPDSGTDVTGTSYFNGATNGVATQGTGGEGYVPELDSDGRIDGAFIKGNVFGNYESLSNNTNYYAETDGFIICNTTNTQYSYVYSDANSSPSTVIMSATNNGVYNLYMPLMCPIKKGNYWRVAGCSNVKWMPFGN